jgi:hypothetical protein
MQRTNYLLNGGIVLVIALGAALPFLRAHRTEFQFERVHQGMTVEQVDVALGSSGLPLPESHRQYFVHLPGWPGWTETERYRVWVFDENDVDRQCEVIVGFRGGQVFWKSLKKPRHVPYHTPGI